MLCPIIGVFYPQLTCRNDSFNSYQPDPHLNKGHHHGNQGHKEMHLIKDKGDVNEDKLQVAIEWC